MTMTFVVSIRRSSPLTSNRPPLLPCLSHLASSYTFWHLSWHISWHAMSRLTLLSMFFCAILAIAFASPLPSNTTVEQGSYSGIVSLCFALTSCAHWLTCTNLQATYFEVGLGACGHTDSNGEHIVAVRQFRFHPKHKVIIIMNQSISWASSTIEETVIKWFTSPTPRTARP